jgi:hypothetical protein
MFIFGNPVYVQLAAGTSLFQAAWQQNGYAVQKVHGLQYRRPLSP